MPQKLPLSFYTRDDVAQISKELLGKVLCTHIDGQLTAGKITETEAYCGRGDKACHAYNGRRTARTEIMYAEGGKAYVYLCYGIHNLFNVVTNVENQADAVLIRALEPLDGIDTILERRKMDKITPRLTAGPGSLTVAMGIDKSLNKISLLNDQVWIEDRGYTVSQNEIICSPRIGVAYAEEDALRPWRFYMKGSEWVSGG